MAKGYSELANELVSAANGVDYAYRDTGGGEDGLPLVLLQHFRGNLDNWDPAHSWCRCRRPPRGQPSARSACRASSLPAGAAVASWPRSQVRRTTPVSVRPA